MSACSVFVYDGDTPLDLTKAVIGLEWGDMKGELAARAVLRMNARMGGRRGRKVCTPYPVPVPGCTP